MSRRWVLIGGIAAAVIAFDQLTKHWALNRLSGGQIIDVIATLRFNLAFNTGMAFSMGGSGSGAIIGSLAIGIVVVLLIVARRIESRPQLVLIGIVIGGAIGNIIDRLFRSPLAGQPDGFMSGAVVDFIDVQFWPIWNIADMAVVLGGISLAVLSARAPVDEESSESDQSSDAPESSDGSESSERPEDVPGSDRGAGSATQPPDGVAGDGEGS